MNYKNREKIIAHSIFLLGSIIVLYPFFSILFLALSEPGKRISGFTVPSGFYFDNFIKDIPNMSSLAKIKENKLLKYWEGLGYYRRAKNLLASSKLLVKKYNSKLPRTIEEVKKLPGVGEYTANALLGLIHNQPTIAIDGNVKRVFARLLNKKKEKINYEELIALNKKINSFFS